MRTTKIDQWITLEDVSREAKASGMDGILLKTPVATIFVKRRKIAKLIQSLEKKLNG